MSLAANAPLLVEKSLWAALAKPAVPVLFAGAHTHAHARIHVHACTKSRTIKKAHKNADTIKRMGLTDMRLLPTDRLQFS
jgi:hypothetical protein